jgi:hypothetical protein
MHVRTFNWHACLTIVNKKDNTSILRGFEPGDEMVSNMGKKYIIKTIQIFYSQKKLKMLAYSLFLSTTIGRFRASL